MAVLTTFTVGGTNVIPLAQVSSLRVEKRLNARSVATFRLRDADGDGASYRPAVRDEVLVVVDGVTEFLGIVWRIDEMPIVNARGVDLTVRCVDYAALLDLVFFNGPIEAGLLRDVSAPLVQNLAAHGIIQDPGTDAGPAVGAQSFPFVSITNGLNDLSLESGWVWRVQAQIGTNVPTVGFYEPGTVSAPQDFTTAVGRVERASFARDLTRYVNEVWVRYGEGTRTITQVLAGDGAAREWRLENDLILPYPGTVHVVRSGGVTDETFSLLGAGGVWQYDRANVWNQRLVHASGTVLGSGEYAEFTYTAQFPGATLARDDDEYLTNGPFTVVEDLPNVFDRATALAYAEAILRRRGGVVRFGKVRTAVAGYAPIQTVTINLPALQVNSSAFLVTEVVMFHRTVGPGSVHHFGYDVAVIEGNEFQENWLDFYLPDRRDRGFGVVPPDGAGGVGGEQPPGTTPSAEYVTSGPILSPAGARGVTLTTAGTTAWTNTSWVEVLSAANAPTAFWAIEGVHVENTINLGESELDIGLGPSGSEQVVATLRIGGNTQQVQGALLLPLVHGPITPNTRVAVRARMRDEISGNSIADTEYVKLVYYEVHPPGITATTRALQCAPFSSLVTVTASSTAWANGSWAQVTASTSESWQLAAVNVTEADVVFNTSGDEIEVDVGVGAAASEVVITTVRVHVRQSACVSMGVVLDPILINKIPIGSRVAVRARHRRAATLTFNIALQYYGGSL